MISEYKISEVNLEWLKSKIDKINKRVIKLHQPEIKLEIVSEEFVVSEDTQNAGKVLTINITGDKVDVAGYKFIATINHTYETGNIIRNISGKELDTKYWTIDGICEHCHTNRRRKETVLLENEEGHIIQVGKSCLKDFIGYDINNQLKYVNLLEKLDTEISSCGINFDDVFLHYVELKHLLNITFNCIEKYGWISRGKAKENECISTSDIVKRILIDNRLNEEEKLIRDSSFNDIDFVNESLSWIRNNEGITSDYMHNLKTICSSEYIDYKEIGIACSLLSTYRIYKKQHEERVVDNRISKYVGNIGERNQFQLTISKIISYTTIFGIRYIVIFKDIDGNIFIWRTNNVPNTFKENEELILKGTIKEHVEYKGVKQTCINRCLIVK